jgi:hypothetical protein
LSLPLPFRSEGTGTSEAAAAEGTATERAARSSTRITGSSTTTAAVASAAKAASAGTTGPARATATAAAGTASTAAARVTGAATTTASAATTTTATAAAAAAAATSAAAVASAAATVTAATAVAATAAVEVPDWPALTARCGVEHLVDAARIRATPPTARARQINTLTISLQEKAGLVADAIVQALLVLDYAIGSRIHHRKELRVVLDRRQVLVLVMIDDATLGATAGNAALVGVTARNTRPSRLHRRRRLALGLAPRPRLPLDELEIRGHRQRASSCVDAGIVWRIDRTALGPPLYALEPSRIDRCIENPLALVGSVLISHRRKDAPTLVTEGHPPPPLPAASAVPAAASEAQSARAGFDTKRSRD